MNADAGDIAEEDLFVHYGGGSDIGHRVLWDGKPGDVRYLMKFDDEVFFNEYIVPLIEYFYRDYPNAFGAPGHFCGQLPWYSFSMEERQRLGSF
jgi:hypothetical protein